MSVPQYEVAIDLGGDKIHAAGKDGAIKEGKPTNGKAVKGGSLVRVSKPGIVRPNLDAGMEQGKAGPAIEQGIIEIDNPADLSAVEVRSLGLKWRF